MPIFLIGSVIGAFIGAFVGATVMELSRSRDGKWRGAVRVGYGALIGRLAGSAMKAMFGMAIATLALVSALG